MDASYKIQRGIHVHLIQFFMCPEFWVHIKGILRFSPLLSECTPYRYGPDWDIHGCRLRYNRSFLFPPPLL